eukprot:Protomagalhaensia_wolfi_Nauph_80__786@NODE_1453_length_1524_cov_20_762963_g1123_i0_p1_GENE_NODE_1453_length_1524_cov_20_762963_g1123_i0NODE_1453_length_1524_cov_20_762963_g1123_i0_p1_ORF_typecomplete_len158_score15_56_NODE_1453_length_1524_cov_20_762963_g1123_i0355828
MLRYSLGRLNISSILAVTRKPPTMLQFQEGKEAWRRQRLPTAVIPKMAFVTDISGGTETQNHCTSSAESLSSWRHFLLFLDDFEGCNKRSSLELSRLFTIFIRILDSVRIARVSVSNKTDPLKELVCPIKSIQQLCTHNRCILTESVCQIKLIHLQS